VIFMPQWIADGDDVGPWRVGITRPQVLGQGARGLGNNLNRAFGDPAKAVATSASAIPRRPGLTSRSTA
jgi:hypothetical protein